MSYTTVLAIHPGERFEELEELCNSWHSAPLIWDAIWNTFGEKRHEYDTAMTAGDRLWALHRDPRLSEAERAVFMMTFDRAYVLKRDFATAAGHLAEFMRLHNVGGHWVRIRDLYLSDPDVPAIGLHCTSVAENPFQGTWNEEAEEYDQIDWSEAYSIYEPDAVA
jgi:hypothetical protein